MTIKELKQQLDEASGGDDTRQVRVSKITITGHNRDYEWGTVVRVLSNTPENVKIIVD